jgi:hypothetical protein
VYQHTQSFKLHGSHSQQLAKQADLCAPLLTMSAPHFCTSSTCFNANFHLAVGLFHVVSAAA